MNRSLAEWVTITVAIVGFALFLNYVRIRVDETKEMSEKIMAAIDGLRSDQATAADDLNYRLGLHRGGSIQSIVRRLDAIEGTMVRRSVEQNGSEPRKVK